MKLSTWLRAAALTQLSMMGSVALGSLVPFASMHVPSRVILPMVGVMLLNVAWIAFVWLPVLRSADGVARAEAGSADPARLDAALWSLGSHFKRVVLLALSAPLLMALASAVFWLVDTLGYDVIWLF